MAALMETSGMILSLCKNISYKECSKIVINTLCKNTQKHVGVYIGYGNKEKMINIIEEHKTKVFKQNKSLNYSKPYIEKYECNTEQCKCENVNYYEF